MTVSLAEVVEALASKRPLAHGVLHAAFTAILRGEWTPAQAAAFATALRVTGESADAVTAGVSAMREAMVTVDHGLPLVFDTCGTGGDGHGTLNVSTIAAIVVAACGVPVAKHGNRSVSSRAGSADFLEALGIPIALPIERHLSLLRTIGITFLFAPAFHPALQHVAQVRRELGFRTVWNALGPLCNPARATHQLIGVYSHELLDIAANALATLGTTRAWVVRSEDGLDEISPAAPTHVRVVESGTVTNNIIDAATFRLPASPLEALRGGEAKDNAAIALEILSGRPHPARTAVALNAAASLTVALGRPPPECTDMALDAIASGRAGELLECWKREANRELA